MNTMNNGYVCCVTCFSLLTLLLSLLTVVLASVRAHCILTINHGTEGCVMFTDVHRTCYILAQ